MNQKNVAIVHNMNANFSQDWILFDNTRKDTINDLTVSFSWASLTGTLNGEFGIEYEANEDHIVKVQPSDLDGNPYLINTANSADATYIEGNCFQISLKGPITRWRPFLNRNNITGGTATIKGLMRA